MDKSHPIKRACAPFAESCWMRTHATQWLAIKIKMIGFSSTGVIQVEVSNVDCIPGIDLVEAAWLAAGSF
jgi:hypothetical protein